MGDRLPENRILSHDLLEGCYARSGLVSDVQLVEESPARYDADVDRRHRWIRGDWQVVGWLMPMVRLPVHPDAGDRREPRGAAWVPNPLSGLSRLKIADNLRRSLAPAALTLLFLFGWTVLPSPWVWTLAGLAILFAPPLVASLADVLRKPQELRLGQHLRGRRRRAWAASCSQALLSLACLPYEAAFSLDAIARTVARLWVTRRRLLQWQPSAEASRRRQSVGTADLWRTFARMWVGPALAAITFAGLAAYRPIALWFAAPGAGPVVALARDRLVDQPAAAAATVPAQRRADAAICGRWPAAPGRSSTPTSGRKTTSCRPTTCRSIPSSGWRTARRRPTSACRCCPAWRRYDFGYITLGQLIDRTRATLDTMDRLETLPGPLLQLVRHAVAAAAAAALRVHRRQRQPRRPPADPARRPAVAGGRPAAAPSAARRPGRHAAAAAGRRAAPRHPAARSASSRPA